MPVPGDVTKERGYDVQYHHPTGEISHHKVKPNSRAFLGGSLPAATSNRVKLRRFGPVKCAVDPHVSVSVDVDGIAQRPDHIAPDFQDALTVLA